MTDETGGKDAGGTAKRGVNTTLAHAGWNPRDYHGFVNPPVVHASTVLFPDADSLFGRKQRYIYGTRATPTSDALGSAVDALEGSAGTICVPSGLASVTVPLLAYLSAGDHFLCVDSVYHPTRRFADDMLKRLGVETTYYDPSIGAGIAELMRPNTKVVWTEAPGSNTFEMQDIAAISAAAHDGPDGGAVVMMDNTWATPLYFRPLDHGVDISVHAATKYPAGHSDVLLGLASANERCWERLYDTYLTMGCCAGPDDVYQTLRGLRSMGVRLDHHGRSALAIAKALEGRAGVRQVLHPALPSFEGHEIWKRDFSGASGLFSIVLDNGGSASDREKAAAFLDALQIFGLGYSWGGYESLAVMSQLEDRVVTRSDYGGPVMRLQIGLEDVDDLLADLERGLDAAAKV